MNEDPESAADRAFEQRAKAGLRRAVADLSPEVRARLEEMASRAARESPRRPLSWRWARPVSGGVAAAALAVVLLRTGDVPPPGVAGPQADDLALLLNVENLDLLEQMEFYQWLDREPGVLDGDAAAPVGAQRS